MDSCPAWCVTYLLFLFCNVIGEKLLSPLSGGSVAESIRQGRPPQHIYLVSFVRRGSGHLLPSEGGFSVADPGGLNTTTFILSVFH